MKLHTETSRTKQAETLADYMIREMAAELQLHGSKPDAYFCERAEEERAPLERGPWSLYEQRIKQAWEQGRSYSTDLAEGLRQQH